MTTLIESFKQVPDFRKARGNSHPLSVLLLLIVMGMLAGDQGYRPLHIFAQEHQQALCHLLGLEQLRVPSHFTFRRMMMGLDFLALSDAFEGWMLSEQAIHLPEPLVVAMDGKRIRQPLTDENGKQRFVGLVSLFATEVGLPLKLGGLIEQNNSGLKVVQTLLETLQLEGVLITMDALYTQKSCGRSLPRVMTIW